MKEVPEKNHYLQYLNKLAIEIKHLEKITNHQAIYKLIHRITKASSQAFHTTKHFIPSICTIITYLYLVNQQIFGISFIKNEVKRPDYIKREYTQQFNGINVISSVLKYDPFTEYVDCALFYGEWNKNSDNTYSRLVTNYSFNYFTEEMAINLLNGTINLSGDIIKEVTVSTQTCSNLTSEELNNENYFSVILYDPNKNSFSIVKENEITNSISLLIFLLIALKLLPNKQKVLNSINQINDKYQKTEYDSIQKKLLLKASNYHRLTRK